MAAGEVVNEAMLEELRKGERRDLRDKWLFHKLDSWLQVGEGPTKNEGATNQRQCEVLPWPGIPNSGACTLQAGTRKPAENHAIACNHPPISLRLIGLFPPQQITTHSAINGAANCTLLESQNGCKQRFPRGLAVASINGFTLQSFFLCFTFTRPRRV